MTRHRPPQSRADRARPTAGFVLAALVLAAGCAYARMTDPGHAVSALRNATVERSEARADPIPEPDPLADPCHIVLTCHGILWDLGSQWDVTMRDEILERGGVGVGVTYFGEPFGVWLRYGADAPAERLAHIADAVTELHEASGCDRPLVLDGVGYSLGGDALLEAARRCRHARFRELVLVHTSTPAFTGEARSLLDSGRVGHITSHWSPIDGATLFAPLGAGQFGLRFHGPRVRNVRSFAFHGAVAVLNEGRRRRILDDLFDPGSLPVDRHETPVGPVFREALADWLERQHADVAIRRRR